MHVVLKTSIVAASLMVGLAANAQSGGQGYAGVSLSQIDYDVAGLSSANPLGVSIKLGTRINPYLAIEARVGTGIQTDTVAGNEIKLKNFYGGYAKAIAPLAETFSAYGLLGYTQGKIEARNGVASATSSDGDVSYGLGADWSINKALSLNLEWARLFKGSNYKVNAVSIGLTTHF